MQWVKPTNHLKFSIAAFVRRWGKDTYHHLLQLLHSSEAMASGVSMVYSHALFMEPTPDPFWHDIVFGFRRLSAAELVLYSSNVTVIDSRHDGSSSSSSSRDGGGGQLPTSSTSSQRAGAHQRLPNAAAAGAVAAAATGFVDGYSFNTIVCEGRLYMRWLTHQIQASGSRLVQRHITDLSQLESEHYDIIVNCCGLGAAKLCNDEHSYPIRGQITRVHAPWVKQAVFGHFPDQPYYIIPNRQCVVLGGTGQIGYWNTNVSVEDAARIMERCCQMLPSLQHAELIDHWVGLRPGRSRLRLEAEVVSMPGGGDVTVVHNYGHGGSGLTLAWGTAGDVVRLVSKLYS